MNCAKCHPRSCRTLEACAATVAESPSIVARYRSRDTQPLVQAAARLVDNGLAGTLSRIQELERFILDRDYSKVDLAVVVGLCVGHDILFTKVFSRDQTTLVVKDRVHRHRPLDALADGGAHAP